jgi:hypothetical protein
MKLIILIFKLNLSQSWAGSQYKYLDEYNFCRREHWSWQEHSLIITKYKHNKIASGRVGEYCW